MVYCLYLMKEWTVVEVGDLTKVAKEVVAVISNKTDDKAQVLALHGDLGAGKTTFMQVLALELGVTEVVTSPTFVIMKQYLTSGAPANLVHIDAYRIEDLDEMRPLGFDNLLNEPNTLICIEWAEKIAPLLPESTIHLKFINEGEKRRIILT